MKTAVICFALLLLWLVATHAHGQTTQAQRAACTLDWLHQHLNVREATGRNDGPAVAAIIRAGGGTAADRPEWCGFTQTAANKSCGLPFPANGMQGAARYWFLPGPRLVYTLGGKGTFEAIQPGYKVGIWHGNAIHHITCAETPGRAVRKGRPARGWWCLAGNEGTGTSAGVHRTFYAAPSIYAAANWLY